MERGHEINRYRRHAKHPAESSSSNISFLLGDNFSNSTANASNISNFITPTTNPNDNNTTAAQQFPQQQNAPQCNGREQEQYMPTANVIRIMRGILPPHAKISDDAKETIQECVSEYISFITGEANDRCQSELRKTITAEDVLWAMGKLGFDDYIEPLTLFLNRYRQSENVRTSLRDPAVFKRSATMDYGSIGMQPYTPILPNMGDQQGMFDPSVLSGYFRDASGSGSSSGGSSQQNDLANFDPLAPFK